METYYLIDFENVHNDGLENIDSLSKDDHVHIFSTENAMNIRMDIVFAKGINIQGHIVPARKQSLDMHLVSYLGHLLGIHGKQCAYIIISNDTDYDNIIEFWKEEGYPNITRRQKISGNTVNQKKAAQSAAATAQPVNRVISEGMAYDFSGSDRCELNQFMQHGLMGKGYSGNDANRVCKYVIAHCNDESILSGIHNDLKREYDDCSEVYADVKSILGEFVTSKGKVTKRESQIRSFFDQHFRKKIYVDHKEEIIVIILNAKSKQQINNKLLKLYSDGNTVKHMYQVIQPLIKNLPGK